MHPDTTDPIILQARADGAGETTGGSGEALPIALRFDRAAGLQAGRTGLKGRVQEAERRLLEGLARTLARRAFRPRRGRQVLT